MLSSRSWYAASIEEFCQSSPDAIAGALLRSADQEVNPEQRDAWLAELQVLRQSLLELNGYVFLEFSIPRMGSRADAVLVLGSTVFVLEFKVGARHFSVADRNQVWDYALDLKNFHKGSHELPIIPVLIATESSQSHHDTPLVFAADGICPPIAVNSEHIRAAIDNGLAHAPAGPLIKVEPWIHSPYHPTPTIIEAARALYANHSVAEIARSEAEATNLAVSARHIESLIDEARESNTKLICFLTGVPGAGKTLVGLDIATQRSDPASQTHAVFLSGNGPLVAVLREVLTRDGLRRKRLSDRKARKGEVGTAVKAFIQNVHHYRDEALRNTEPPADRVAIFDEAQRAWNRQKTSTFMRQRKGQPNFDQSEPEFLIAYMDRHADWAVIVCLVGGGQEINGGEAGIGAWLDAIESQFPEWHIHISPNLIDSEYGAADRIKSTKMLNRIEQESSLHLAVSMRSFRAENVSAFVKAVLDCDEKDAEHHLRKLVSRYPTAITRDLRAAKEWIRSHARGSERYGMVASSRAMRLKPHAIDVRVAINPVHWFLNGPSDPRASDFLEDAATEFQVQGLELDWVCATWDADFRKAKSGWSYHDFRGDKWTNVKNADNRSYVKNTYRVLLTRARQGMVIFVPPGDGADATRSPEFYDNTFEYLAKLGMQVI